jgi:hypothetical protein
MKLRKALTVALVATAGLLGVAAPAHATTALSLWMIGNSDGKLYSVNPSTGATTAVGAGVGVSNIMAVALNPKTSVTYLVDSDCHLYTLNMTSGVGTNTGHSITASLNGHPIAHCDAMTIDGRGIGHFSGETANPNHATYYGHFTPSTGAGTVLAATANYYDWMAFDPRDGKLYAQNDDDPIYRVNPTTGAETQLNSGMNPYSYSVIIDSTGHMWTNDWNNLTSGSISNWTATVVGPYSNSGATNALFTTTNVFPAESTSSPSQGLANTGFSPTGTAGISLALIGLGLIGFFARRKLNSTSSN